MPVIVPGAELQVSRQIKLDFAFHLVAVHCNLAMIEAGWSIADMVEYHRDEHFGPCGLRHHPYGDLSWDEHQLEEVLEDGEKWLHNAGNPWPVGNHADPPLPEIVAAAVERWEAEQGRAHERQCGPDCKSDTHAPAGGPGSFLIPHDAQLQAAMLALNVKGSGKDH